MQAVKFSFALLSIGLFSFLQFHFKAAGQNLPRSWQFMGLLLMVIALLIAIPQALEAVENICTRLPAPCKLITAKDLFCWQFYRVGRLGRNLRHKMELANAPPCRCR